MQVKVVLQFVVFAVCFLTISGLTSAQDFSVSSSSKRDRQAVLGKIPFQAISKEAQQKILPILKKPSIYRRLPVETIRCDKDLHVFLVRHPEVVVNTWQLMGITQVTTSRVAPYVLKANDGAGTKSTVELVYGTPNLHVFYGQGMYEGTLLRNKVSADVVMVVQSDYGNDQNGLPTVTERLDVFVRVHQLGAKIVAKTLVPIFGKAADQNFVESARFLTRLHDAAENNSAGITQMANKMQNVDPQIRKKFSQIAQQVAHRAVERNVVAQKQARMMQQQRSYRR